MTEFVDAAVAFQVELQRPFGDQLNRHFSF
jgi:hypothetical protein